jgi:hypothetical protein
VLEFPTWYKARLVSTSLLPPHPSRCSSSRRRPPLSLSRRHPLHRQPSPCAASPPSLCATGSPRRWIFIQCDAPTPPPPPLQRRRSSSSPSPTFSNGLHHRRRCRLQHRLDPPHRPCCGQHRHRNKGSRRGPHHLRVRPPHAQRGHRLCRDQRACTRPHPSGLGLPGFPTCTGALTDLRSPARLSRKPPPGFTTRSLVADATWAPPAPSTDSALATALATIQAAVAASQERERAVSLAWEQERAMGQALTTQVATA